MDNLNYLFAAYSIIWLVLFGYVLFLLGRERKLRRDIESLKNQVKEQS